MSEKTIKRVLVAHNLYLAAARSGEDSVYRDECRKLVDAGVDVVRYEKSNDALQAAGFVAKLNAARVAGWSGRAYDDISAVIRRTKPQVAHFHNVFPQITAAAYAACRDLGVPVVQTLHNYRWNCASGLLLRNERVCEDCWGRSPLPAVVHRCYQEGFGASIAAVVAQAVYARHAVGNALVSRFIALTEFSRTKHIAAGLPPERVVVKANFAGEEPTPGSGVGGYVIFVGRFGVEKGVRTLLQAWELMGGSAPTLKMVGGGPLSEWVASEVSAKRLRIDIVGPRSRAEVMELMQGAALTVVPSECYEGFPLVIAESLACGTPVVASRTGGLPELVRPGCSGALFAVGDARELGQCVAAMLADPDSLVRLRHSSRDLYVKEFSAARSLERLMKIYGEAMGVSSRSGVV